LLAQGASHHLPAPPCRSLDVIPPVSNPRRSSACSPCRRACEVGVRARTNEPTNACVADSLRSVAMLRAIGGEGMERETHAYSTGRRRCAAQRGVPSSAGTSRKRWDAFACMFAWRDVAERALESSLEASNTIPVIECNDVIRKSKWRVHSRIGLPTMI
jgi:hypothetical protein